MSLIKLAIEQTNKQPIIVINQQTDPMSGSSKALNTRNFLAAGVGGTTGFATKELIEQGSKLTSKIPTFNKANMSHRYASRMGSIVGGLVGAGSVYALTKKKKENKPPSMYFV